MEVRIKNLHDAAVRNLRSMGRYQKFEEYNDKNHAIMNRLFNDLCEGKISYIHLKNDTMFRCYHRSTRDGVKVQLSCGFYKDGELIPTNHVNINSFYDFTKEGFSSGIYEVA